jgi:hypothetical protein
VSVKGLVGDHGPIKGADHFAVNEKDIKLKDTAELLIASRYMTSPTEQTLDVPAMEQYSRNCSVWIMRARNEQGRMQ